MNPIQAMMATLQRCTPEVARRLNRTISLEQVLTALCIDRRQTIKEVAARTWTVETLAETLKQCLSIASLPEILAIAEFDGSIIPTEIERAFFEEKVKHKGEIWFIHKYDADPFPSNPHAHNHESNLKLHLGNGTLYMGKRVLGTLTRKDFEALRGKVKHVDLPPLESA